MRLNFWALIFLVVTRCGSQTYQVGTFDKEHKQADNPLNLEYVGQSSARPQVVRVSERYITFTRRGFETLSYSEFNAVEITTTSTTSFSFELTAGTAKGEFEKNGTLLTQPGFEPVDYAGYNLIIHYPGKPTQEVLVGRLR